MKSNVVFVGYAQLVLNLILIRLEQQTLTRLQSLLRLAPHPSLGYDDQATMPKIWHYINVQDTDDCQPVITRVHGT